MVKTLNKLSIIIPVYNEEARLLKTLEAIFLYLQQKDYLWEIFIVNDGSTDHTAEIVKEFQKKIRNLRLLDNKKNRGKGYAVKQGMLAASGAYRLFMDADNAVTIDYIEKFSPYFNQGYAIVIGSIELPGSKIHGETARLRRFLGRLSKKIIKLLILPDICDSQRGFKCFTAQAANVVFKHQTVKRWLFDVEILAIARLFGFKTKEVPVSWYNYSGSKVNMGSYLYSLFELLKIKWCMIFGEYRKLKKTV